MGESWNEGFWGTRPGGTQKMLVLRNPISTLKSAWRLESGALSSNRGPRRLPEPWAFSGTNPRNAAQPLVDERVGLKSSTEIRSLEPDNCLTRYRSTLSSTQMLPDSCAMVKTNLSWVSENPTGGIQ